uniref:COesterase domain-containing protein n=1 Tax=Toxocara canis TaxID=6265 RepID=A0A183VDJ8_TOXCA
LIIAGKGYKAIRGFIEVCTVPTLELLLYGHALDEVQYCGDNGAGPPGQIDVFCYRDASGWEFSTRSDACRVGILDKEYFGLQEEMSGIPFVAPPIGKNRFSKPKSVQPWDGILDTTRYRAACMSDTTYTSTPQKNISEDCLYLNVFADPHCTVCFLFLHACYPNYYSCKLARLSGLVFFSGG